MDIRVLRYVVAVGECGTFSRAATRLFVSRQAVSKALRFAERETGVRLFERQGETLGPTERGRAFLAEATEVLAAFDRMGERWFPGALGGVTLRNRSLAVALVSGGSAGLPAGFFEGFRAAHPDVVLSVEEMSSDSVVRHVEDGTYDVGILGTHPLLIGEFESACINTSGIWVLADEKGTFADRMSLALGDLNGAPFVTAGPHNHLHRFVFERCAEAGVRPDVRAMATDGEMIGRLARETGSLCFGFSPDLVAPLPGTRAISVDVPGGEAFGTYVIRRKAASGVSGAMRTDAAEALWDYARAAGSRVG